MAREYATEAAPSSIREYAGTPPPEKFTPDQDTVYSPEGIPLVAPSSMQAPAGGETAAKIMTDITGAPVRAGLAIAKPFADVVKWAGYGQPAQALKQADVGIKQQGPEFMGVQSPLSTISSLAGDLYGLKSFGTVAGKLAAPIESAVPAVRTAANWVANRPLVQSVLGGTGVGVLGADPNAGSAVTEGAIGAALSAGTHGLIKGLGAAADPALARLKELEKLGYDKAQIIRDSTLGQLLGGGMQKVENFLNSVPFGGVASKINAGVKSIKNMTNAKLAALEAQKNTGIDALNLAAQKTKDEAAKALEQQHAQSLANIEAHHADKAAALKEEESGFHLPFINRALSHIGTKIEDGVTGNKALAAAQEAISGAYKTALDKIGNLRLTKDRIADLQNFADKYKSSLGGEDSQLHTLLKSKVDDLLATTNKNRWLTPENWQGMLSDLSKESYKAKTSGGVLDTNYGKALGDLKDKWMDLIEGQAGSDLFKKANQAYSEFKIPEKAGSYLSSLKNEGEFNPDALLRAISSETSTTRLAGGESELQKLAQEGYKSVMDKRQGLKDYIKTNLKAFEEAKAKDYDLLKQSNDLAQRNIKLRQDALKGKTDVQKDILNQTAKDVESHPVGNYAEKRATYNLAGVGAVTGGGATANLLFGINPLLPAMLGGATIAGTNLLYNRPMQTLLKKAATAERPEWMKQAGQALKENAPLGALSAVENYESTRKKPNKGNLP